MAANPTQATNSSSVPPRPRWVHPLTHATPADAVAYDLGSEASGTTQPVHGVSLDQAIRVQIEMTNRQLVRLVVQLNDGLAKIAALQDHMEHIHRAAGALMREMDGLRLVANPTVSNVSPTQTAQRHT